MNDMITDAPSSSDEGLPYYLATIPLSMIRPDPANVRKVKASPEVSNALRLSMSTIGLRNPIKVYRDPEAEDRYLLDDGENRWTQAGVLGWSTIACQVWQHARDLQSVAGQAADGMTQARLHMVDQWEALQRVQAEGYSLEFAAAAIGVSQARAALVNKLGQLHSYLLDAMRGPAGVPNDQQLRLITNAPQDVQLSSWKAATNNGKKPIEHWSVIAQGCNLKRISRTEAIFDVDKSDIVFERDLFAEPGSDDEWTTTDVAGFLAAQKAALDAEAAASKGRIVVVPWSDGDYSASVPKGWRRTWGEPPKRWTKTDERKVFAAVMSSGHSVGEVFRTLAVPVAAAAGSPGSSATGTGHNVERVSAPRDPITKAGQHHISLAKREAVQTQLQEAVPLERMLPLLLIALSGSNVAINDDPIKSYQKAKFNDVVSRLVDDKGVVRDIPSDELRELAATVLSRIVVFRSPNSMVSSGAVAEWIGADIGAETRLPRFDNAEFLKTVSADVLKAAAEEVGIKPLATAGGTRKLLVDHAETWRPPYTKFEAPGPEAYVPDVDEDDDDAPDAGDGSTEGPETDDIDGED